MPKTSLIGRYAAIGAVLVAIVAVALILLTGGTSYQVNAMFANASQIVKGDLVEVAGNSIGTVSNLAITPNGQAALTLNITQKQFQPLPRDTHATIRELSLSGIASRYVQLDLGPSNIGTIKNGGVIPASDTTSEVDLDEIFNTLDSPTRRGIQNLLQGSAASFSGKGAKEAQQALDYLNPAVAASSVLFHQIDNNTGSFTNFLVKSSHLVTDVAQRSSDLSGLVSHLSTVTEALARQRVSLAETLQRLPPFMRLANTTFVNLRVALNDLKPLVDDSKPVAPKLERLLVQLRPLANDSVPTLKDLSQIISQPGPNNDLTDLVSLGGPLADATVRNVDVNGESRPGAFPESTTALNDSTPELATARPYAVDLTGWFEGYSHPGIQDANGAASRIAPVVGVGSLQNGTLDLLPAFIDPTLRSILAFGGLGNTLNGVTGGAVSSATSSAEGAVGSVGSQSGLLTTGQGDRCPGSMERGSVYYPESGFPCNPSEVPTGP